MAYMVKNGSAPPATTDWSIKNLAWSVVEYMQDALIVTTPEGRIIYLNYAAEVLLNITFTQVWKQPVEQVLRPVPLDKPEAAPGKSDGAHSFIAGYCQLEQCHDAGVVHIAISSIANQCQGNDNLLFAIRKLNSRPDRFELLTSPKSQRRLHSNEEFSNAIRDAQRSNGRSNAHYGLLCVQVQFPPALIAALVEGQENAQPASTIAQNILHSIRKGDAACQLSTRKFGILLEDNSTIDSLRMAFKLARALTRSCDEFCTPADRPKVWIGITFLGDHNGSDDSDALMEHALWACYHATQSGRPAAVRIFKPESELAIPGDLPTLTSDSDIGSGRSCR